MDIQIGTEYLLNVSKDVEGENIDYLNSKVISPRYTKWGEISGKRVKVKNKIKILTDYFEATLSNDVNHVFYVTRKMLACIPKLAMKCKCTTKQLFMAGCKCGAFKFEMNTD